MKKLNNKGFSLAELLAVMAILIILMGLAIAATTKIIFDSQKTAYLAEVMVHQKGIRSFIESEEIDVEDENTVYYFNYRLGVDSSESPFDKWEDCYVVVTYSEETGKNSYYWTGLDKEKWGIKLHKEVGEMTKDDIVHNELNNITPGKSIGGRENAIIYNVSEDEDELYSEEERIASNE